MRERRTEILAVLVTALAMAVAAFYPFFHEAGAVAMKLPPGGRVLTLTGISATGTWTQEAVTAGNYWFGSFPPARPVLFQGRPTLLRLKSSDVVHNFYCPGMGMPPVEVYPGRVTELVIVPEREGVFEYFCTTLCGDPHFRMRGELVVIREGAPVPPPSLARLPEYWLEVPPRGAVTNAERGRWLFARNGCFTCHGEKGKGGVPNPNYVKDTVPALNTLATRMLIPDKEGSEAVLAVLDRGEDPKTLSKDPPFARYNAFLAQLQSVRDLIRKGNPPGKKDPKGPQPPLEMPSFAARLSDRDMDDLITYLLKQQAWEGDDK